ncbi:MAG TPA: IS607 family transposase [Methylomicrobium sp.]|nr:IS607 family transposase [Methylomicrobium sp.]
MSYIPLRKAVEKLGMSKNALRSYADQGIIPSIRNPAGQRLFDVDSYLAKTARPRVICYARVSSAKQRDDLERQIQRLRSAYPEAKIIQDIGSGLNFKRKGLRALLERLLCGDKLAVVVTHRDRLARVGMDALQFLIEYNGGQFVVLDPTVGASGEAELTADLLAILHHFSGRMHGQRSHQSKASTPVPNSATEESVPSMVRDFEIRLQRHRKTPGTAEGAATKSLDGCGENNSSGAT